MNKIIVISIIFFLMMLFNKKEFFSNNMFENLKENKCSKNTNLLSEVNMYTDAYCQDNETNNRYINDQRITCRNFVERQILLGNDNTQLCPSDNEVPIKTLDKPLKEFNKLQETGLPEIQTEDSNYPFSINEVKIDLVKLDNKYYNQ